MAPENGKCIVRLSAKGPNFLLPLVTALLLSVQLSLPPIGTANRLQESDNSRPIPLEDDDPAIFELLLSYLYTLDYNDNSLPEKGNELPLEASTNVPIQLGSDQDQDAEVDQTESDFDYMSARLGESQLGPHQQSAASAQPESTNSDFNEESSLMTNVKVYAMADKFDVEELKMLAKEKFEACSRGWPLPKFPSVVQEALTSTPESDRGLRDILRSIIARHVEEICPRVETYLGANVTETRQQWFDVLRDEGAFLYEILGSVAIERATMEENLLAEREDFAASLDSAHQRAEELERRIQTLQTEKSVVSLALTTVKARGFNLLREINSRDNCRHCKEPFQPSFENVQSYDEWPHGGMLRCKKCRTKHSF